MQQTTDPKAIDLFSFKNVIFDLDGTLMDSFPTWSEAFGKTMHERYGDDAEEMALLFFARRHDRLQNIFEAALRHAVDDDLFKKLENALSDTYEAMDDVPFYHGAIQLIEELFEAGKNVYVSTYSRCSNARKRITEAGVAHCIRTALGSTRLDKLTQHVDHFVKRARLPPSEFCAQTVIVGDSKTDMEIARRNGLVGVGVSTTDAPELLYSYGAALVVPHVGYLLRKR